MQSIIFIGYRCTGKTTVAQKLADRLGIPMYDSDSEIERQAEKSIIEIFSQDGEPAFRDLEESIIAEIMTRPAPWVLSTGGGSILRSDTRTRLRKSGYVIWLTATPETILCRMTNDAATDTMRPNLTSLPMRDEVVAVLGQRTPLYAKASHETIDTDSFTTDEIVDKVIDRL